MTHIWLRTMIKATCKQQPQPRVTRCRGLMRTPKEGVDLAGLSQHRVEMRPGCTGAGEPRVVSVITMSLCLVAQSCPTLATTWTAARQAPLSMGFSRQESWSGLPFPTPGDHPKPGIEPGSPSLAGAFLTTKPKVNNTCYKMSTQ